MCIRDSCSVVHPTRPEDGGPSQVEIDARVDLNAFINGYISTDELLNEIKPLVKKCFRSLKVSGGGARGKSADYKWREVERLIVHCKSGKNRSAVLAAALLLILYWPYEYSVEVIYGFLERIRPIVAVSYTHLTLPTILRV